MQVHVPWDWIRAGANQDCRASDLLAEQERDKGRKGGQWTIAMGKAARISQ